MKRLLWIFMNLPLGSPFKNPGGNFGKDIPVLIW